MGEADVQKVVTKLVGILDAEGLPYAIIGALALNQYGHKRVTVDVDLVMREEDLQRFKRGWLGRGYAERVVGTGKLIDTEYSVHIDVWIELKLASGMVAPHRLKDLADVQELIRSAGFAREMAERLDPWVRAKFLELWQAVDQAADADPY